MTEKEKKLAELKDVVKKIKSVQAYLEKIDDAEFNYDSRDFEGVLEQLACRIGKLVCEE